MNAAARKQVSAPRRHRVEREHGEAKAFMRVVQMHEARHPELRWLHAIPNGGARGKAQAGKLKAEGVRAGVADYFLPVARQGFHGLYIELKSMTGSTSREQKDFLADMRSEGYRAEVAKGWEQAWAIVRDYLGGQ